MSAAEVFEALKAGQPTVLGFIDDGVSDGAHSCTYDPSFLLEHSRSDPTVGMVRFWRNGQLLWSATETRKPGDWSGMTFAECQAEPVDCVAEFLMQLGPSIAPLSPAEKRKWLVDDIAELEEQLAGARAALVEHDSQHKPPKPAISGLTTEHPLGKRW